MKAPSSSEDDDVEQSKRAVAPEVPVQHWESPEYRISVPDDLQLHLKGNQRVILFPNNSLKHLMDDHPADSDVLPSLQLLFDVYEWSQEGNDGRLIIYSQFNGIWRRIVIARGNEFSEFNVVVSIYRRERKRVERAIAEGKYRKREV